MKKSQIIRSDLKLLIVTAWYHPFIHPRAHRWTALSEYWAGEGHEVHVVCSRRRECPDETTLNGVRVHRVGFAALMEAFYYYFGGKSARGRVGAPVVAPGRLARLANWLYNATWKKIYFPDDACVWYLPAKNKVFQLLAQEQFDALITVSLPFTSHLVGLSAKRRYPNLFWLADTGDPFSMQPQPLNNRFLYRKRSHRLERLALESADAATVTTAPTLEKYRLVFGEKAVSSMRVIPPLLHPAPSDSPPRLSSGGSPLRIGYFGALYSPTRTPDAFLDLLERTFIRRPVLRERTEAHFYGDIFPDFYKKMKAQRAVCMHGLRSREEVRAAMQNLDILLNIGNKSDFQLPSKAVEYIASGLPVVHLSYTDDDPFTAFFDGYPAFLQLKVKGDRVTEEDLEKWLAWLTGAYKTAGTTGLKNAAGPYLVEAVAKRYGDLLGI